MNTLQIYLELVLNENDINADINQYSDFVKSEIEKHMDDIEFETSADEVNYSVKKTINYNTSGVGSGVYVFCSDNLIEQQVKVIFSGDFLNRCWEDFCKNE